MFAFYRCKSTIGRHSDGGSIILGTGCESKDIIEHQLMHTLGNTIE